MGLDGIIKTNVTSKVIEINDNEDGPVRRLKVEVRTDALRCFQGAYALLTHEEAERLIRELASQISLLNTQIPASGFSEVRSVKK